MKTQTTTRPPSSRAPRAQAVPLRAHSKETLGQLAHMIDDTISVPGSGVDPKHFAARVLGVASDALVAESRILGPITRVTVGFAIAQDHASESPTPTIGADADEPPKWAVMDQTSQRYPTDLHYLRKRDDVVIGVTTDWRGIHLVAYADAANADAATAALNDLFAVGANDVNPFAGRALRAGFSFQAGIVLNPIPPFASLRSDLEFEERIWDALDTHVGAFLSSIELLEGTSLSKNRGILLYGPPGSGKSALVRVLASEAASTATTVVLVDAETMMRQARALYRVADELSPALLIVEELDKQGSYFGELLAAMDSSESDHTGVVTIATANDIGGFDKALLRSARFDLKLEIPLPAVVARQRIFERYLRGLTHVVDIGRAARDTEGFSGADIRELITYAVLARTRGGAPDRPLTTTDLYDAAVHTLESTEPGGQYL